MQRVRIPFRAAGIAAHVGQVHRLHSDAAGRGQERGAEDGDQEAARGSDPEAPLSRWDGGSSAGPVADAGRAQRMMRTEKSGVNGLQLKRPLTADEHLVAAIEIYRAGHADPAVAALQEAGAHLLRAARVAMKSRLHLTRVALAEAQVMHLRDDAERIERASMRGRNIVLEVLIATAAEIVAVDGWGAAASFVWEQLPLRWPQGLTCPAGAFEIMLAELNPAATATDWKSCPLGLRGNPTPTAEEEAMAIVRVALRVLGVDPKSWLSGIEKQLRGRGEN